MIARILVMAAMELSLVSWSQDKSLDILDKFQTTWDATKTYQASFQQSVFDKRLGTRETFEGDISIAKPSRLRWESKTDQSLQILNQKKLIHIQTNARRKVRTVDIYLDSSKTADTRMLNLLAGKVKFKQVYEAKLLQETPTAFELKLIPKSPQWDPYLAEIDKESYLLRALTSDSNDSRVRIDFKQPKQGMELEDALFTYEKKADDVVHENP